MECWTEGEGSGGPICVRDFKPGMCDLFGEFHNLHDCKDFLLIKIREKKDKFITEDHEEPSADSKMECWSEGVGGGGSICVRDFRPSKCDSYGEFYNLHDCKDFLLIKIREEKDMLTVRRYRGAQTIPKVKRCSFSRKKILQRCYFSCFT